MKRIDIHFFEGFVEDNNIINVSSYSDLQQVLYENCMHTLIVILWDFQ